MITIYQDIKLKIHKYGIEKVKKRFKSSILNLDLNCPLIKFSKYSLKISRKTDEQIKNVTFLYHLFRYMTSLFTNIKTPKLIRDIISRILKNILNPL